MRTFRFISNIFFSSYLCILEKETKRTGRMSWKSAYYLTSTLSLHTHTFIYVCVCVWVCLVCRRNWNAERQGRLSIFFQSDFPTTRRIFSKVSGADTLIVTATVFYYTPTIHPIHPNLLGRLGFCLCTRTPHRQSRAFCFFFFQIGLAICF